MVESDPVNQLILSKTDARRISELYSDILKKNLKYQRKIESQKSQLQTLIDDGHVSQEEPTS